jgi:hypothetical protein
MDDSALSLGERVDQRGAFTSRAGTGEGSLPLLGPAARAWLVLVPDQTNPSPVRLRLVKTPQPDTLSPRERAGGSRKERSRNVYEKKGGEGDDSAPKGRNNKAQANGLGLD